MVNVFFKDGTNTSFTTGNSIVLSYINPSWVDISTAQIQVAGGTILSSVPIVNIEYVTYA
jgi:hypothetical protein